MSSQSVQTFGKKKTATAVAHVKAGSGLIKVNGKPLSLVQPEILRFKVRTATAPILSSPKTARSKRGNC